MAGGRSQLVAVVLVLTVCGCLAQVPAGTCRRQQRADEAGSFGVQGCGSNSVAYCCSQTGCVPDRSGSLFAPACTNATYNKVACCPQIAVQASRCTIGQSASQAGSLGSAGCGSNGKAAYCCSNSLCVPDDSGSVRGGSCSGAWSFTKPACCPVPAKKCDVLATASAAGSYGRKGCASKGSAAFCCSAGPRAPNFSSARCITDTSSNDYGGSCTQSPYSVAACCPV